jgi:lipoic acid synthetase
MIQSIKPEWLKIRPPFSEKFFKTRNFLKELGLNTVCQEAHCPNQSKCWSKGTATFMILGKTCTRNCSFCSVKKSVKGEKISKQEAKKIALAIKKMNLSYAVITSVNRDDLEDMGANHFVECVKEIKKNSPKTIIELLIPDFQGKKELIKIISNSGAEIISHNLETVKELQKKVRDPKASYEQSLNVLKQLKKFNSKIFTKSSLMLGLGEKKEQVVKAMNDLRKVNVDIFYLGQYLQPSKLHYPVKKFVSPQDFNELKKIAEKKGFLLVASAPFVRSSFNAGELFIKKLKKLN